MRRQGKSYHREQDIRNSEHFRTSFHGPTMSCCKVGDVLRAFNIKMFETNTMDDNMHGYYQEFYQAHSIHFNSYSPSYGPPATARRRVALDAKQQLRSDPLTIHHGHPAAAGCLEGVAC